MLACLVACLSPAGAAAETSCAWQPLQRVGTLAAAKLVEASGLAASARRPGLFWAVNDSGNAPVLYALDEQGRDLGTVKVAGASNRDWEDIASFALDGKPYLLIADTGDNAAQYRHSRLYVVEEPEPGAAGSVALAWSVDFAYADGPRDCESVAVDTAATRVLLLSKRDSPPRIYEVPLRPVDGRVARAEPLATLDWPVSSAAHGRRMPWALLPNQPTAWDITSRWIAILTYGRVALYRRGAGEPLTEALAGEPAFLEMKGGFQAEALALAGDAFMYVTGEGEQAPLLASACTCEECDVP